MGIKNAWTKLKAILNWVSCYYDFYCANKCDSRSVFKCGAFVQDAINLGELTILNQLL